MPTVVLAFFDATHNFVWSGTYDMPFGKGRTWGNDWHPVANAILGGWNVSSIISLRTGFPDHRDQCRSLAASGSRWPTAKPSRDPVRCRIQTLKIGLISLRSHSQTLGAFGNSGVSILRPA